MPTYNYSLPIAGRSQLGSHGTLPTIDGVSADEVQRFENLPVWECSCCGVGGAAKDCFFHCQNCHGLTSYILCSTCYDVGVRCHEDHVFLERHVNLKYDTQSFYTATAIPKRHIRVLRVFEAPSFDAPLNCVLSIEPVDEPLEYDTLSYCWGSSARTKLIKIGGSLFPITPNLELALRRYRAVGKRTAIWADAICINQADNIEKAAQVSLMRDVYKNARCVYVYLGEKDPALRIDLVVRDLQRNKGGSAEESALAARAMEKMLEQAWFSRVWIIQEVCACTKAEVMYGNLTFDFRLLQDKLAIDTSQLQDMNADPRVTTLGHIRQMGMVGKNFRVHHSANLRYYYKKYHALASNQELVQKTIEFEKNVKLRPYPLLELLQDFRDMEATNPRDKIYALLGLATDIEFQHDGSNSDFTGAVASVPHPDYNKPVQDVYYDFAHYFILSGSLSEVMHTASLNKPSSSLASVLPSWVPDWTSYKKGVHPVRLDQPFGQYLFHAGGPWASATLPARVNEERRSLCVEGGIADFITHISRPLDSLEQGRRIPERVNRGINMLIKDAFFCRKATEDGFQPLTIRDALTNNAVDLVMDCEDCRKGAPTWLDLLAAAMVQKYMGMPPGVAGKARKEFFGFSNECWRAFQAGRDKEMELHDPIEAAFAGVFDETRIEAVAGGEEPWLPHREYVSHLLTGRRLAFTDKGRVGIMPEATEVNDVVCIVKGGVTPFVIREEGEDWRLVGDAYVRGIMQGEVLEEEGFVEMELELR